MQNTPEDLPVTSIRFIDIVEGERFRKDYKDLEALAKSIHEQGIIHPITINALTNEIIAGGRRYAAFKLLREQYYPLYEVIPVTRRTVLDEAHLRLLELEENMRREDMNWQEYVLGISNYHDLKRNENGFSKWTQSATGNLLGVSQGRVSVLLEIAKDLKRQVPEILKCATLTDAVQVKIKSRLDEANKLKLLRVKASAEKIKEASLSPKVSELLASMKRVDGTVNSEPTAISSAHNQFSSALNVPKVSLETISGFFNHGSSLDLLPKIASTQVIHHIISDPPYGISMDLMDTNNSVERIVDTHQVESNLKLLEEFLRIAFDCIAIDGFMALWYDLDHHEKLLNWSKKIGWKTCRWNFVWCKESPCRNSNAMFNITKATEVCMLFRRSEQSIIKTKQSRNWLLSKSITSATHPFVKPQAIWNYLIETVSNEGQTICDPFCGEGSSLVSIFKTNRVPIGIEVDENHIAAGLSFVEREINSSLDLIL